MSHDGAAIGGRGLAVRPHRLTLGGALLCLACGGAAALADDIVLPAGVLSRDRPFTVAYRLAQPITGTATLDVEWTDALGRLVEQRRLTFHPTDATALTFELDARRAVAIGNELRTHLRLDGAEAREAR